MHSHTSRAATVIAAIVAACLSHISAASAAPVPTPPDQVNKMIVHQVPQVPLTINGEPVPASTITKYNGRPLYMAVVPDGSLNGQLQAFTEAADFERFVREQGGPEHAAAKPQRVLTPEVAAAPHPVSPPKLPESGPDQTDMSVDSPVSYIFSGDYGLYFSLGAGVFTGFADLTQVDMVCIPWCISWNDEASSASASDNGLVLFEHIGFSGSALFLPAGQFFPFLSAFGWDNRTSSLRS